MLFRLSTNKLINVNNITTLRYNPDTNRTVVHMCDGNQHYIDGNKLEQLRYQIVSSKDGIV